jgi:hypothetical protein
MYAWYVSVTGDVHVNAISSAVTLQQSHVEVEGQDPVGSLT